MKRELALNKEEDEFARDDLFWKKAEKRAEVFSRMIQNKTWSAACFSFFSISSGCSNHCPHFKECAKGLRGEGLAKRSQLRRGYNPSLCDAYGCYGKLCPFHGICSIDWELTGKPLNALTSGELENLTQLKRRIAEYADDDIDID